jgi:uncharacterized protein
MKIFYALATVLMIFLSLRAPSASAAAGDGAYRAEIEKWRQLHIAHLKAEDGYLSIAGLFWLKEGVNRFGSAAANDIVLPADSVPGQAGEFTLQNGKVTVHLNHGVTAFLDGKPVVETTMLPDTDDKGPSLLAFGDITLLVHASGARQAIRMRDKNSRFLRDFAGLQWFPIDESYRVAAQFVPYDSPREVEMPTILGDVDKLTSPGEVVFTLRGHELRMQALAEDQKLWFVFRDQTSGKETYGAARFLYADLPKDGKTVLDFNESYNPPCAFNPYTTCPLPPAENRLPIRVEAGELRYVHGD